MCVDTHISGGTGKGFALPVRDMLFRFWVAVLLRHAEIDDMDDIGGFCAGSADQEVVGLDVTVDEVLLMDGLDS
jgi:hypothetical protein